LDGLWNVVSGFVGVLVGGFFSYWGIKKQVETSDRHFEKEFEKFIVTYYRDRRREVRSEPLKELSTELAIMATKLEKLAKRGKSYGPPKTKEQENEFLRQAEKDWEEYLKSDHLERVLYSQYDTEILNRVREIRNDYFDIYSTTVTYPDEVSAVEYGQASRAAEEKIRPKVAEIQELINKKLEEL
jgi:hypothetical protein